VRNDTTSSALFGVGAVQLIVGILGIITFSSRFGVIDWIISLSFALYFVLSHIAKRMPFHAAIVGACIYAAYLVFQALVNFRLLFEGLIIKVPVILMLIVAVVSALRLKRRANTPSTKLAY
jgi:hypothetical protein